MKTSDIHIVFFGTSSLAVAALQSLMDANYAIDLVVTMPDAASGRHLKKTPSPIKEFATKHSLPLSQPESIKDPLFLEQVQKLHPTVGVVIAFGQIFPDALLTIPQKGFINIHPSLLPLWRGPSPIQSALAAGDTQTGVTVMSLDAKMDHGPILIQASVEIKPQDTYLTLEQTLATLGAKLLTQSLPKFVEGPLQPRIQNDTDATYCKLLKKTDGLIDWNKSATEISNQIRAYEVFPTSYTFFKEKRIKITKTHVSDMQKSSTPGMLCKENHQLMVQTGNGSLIIDELQPASKKSMTGQAFLAGITLSDTDTFTNA